MFGHHNPYQATLDGLEEALSACIRALRAGIGDLPHAKGKGEIEEAAYQAKRLLEDAIASTRQWRDAYDYHLSGNRTDF